MPDGPEALSLARRTPFSTPDARRGVALALGATCLWSTTGIFIDPLVSRYHLTPVQLTFWRCLFVVAALFEIGGAWLVWQGIREHRGWLWIGAGVIALGLYGFVATLQPDAQFGRILAAYGGVFVAGSLAWGMVADGYRPDRYDIVGALVCLAGVAVIMYAPRARGF